MIKSRCYLICLFCIVLAIIFMIHSFIVFQNASHHQIKEMNDAFLQELTNQTSYNDMEYARIIDSDKIEKLSTDKMDIIALKLAIRLFFSFTIIFITILIYTIKNQKHIVKISQIDALTGLYNRDTLISKIQHFLVQEILLDSYHALFIIDLDGFKKINDTFGHMEGDRVLKAVAVEVSKICKKKDIMGRLGGDEYMIFMKELSSIMAIEFFAGQICNSIINICLTNGVSNAVSGSIGIAIVPIHGTNFEELYRKSDLALYSAKNNGKNQFCIYCEQLEKPC